VSLAQNFVIGLLSGFALLLSLASDLGGELLLALVSLPLGVLVAVALFGDTAAGWRARLARGAVGAVVAGAAGIATVVYLKGRTDWFDWHDEHGGGLWLVILVALSAFPGGVAALAARPSRGLTLAGGFTCGLASLYVVRGAPNFGLIVLLVLGTVVGTMVGALGRERA
jgi:hypothetical protein